MTKARGTPIGRGSLFRPKINDREHRYQGFVTEVGRQRFEQARHRLADIAQETLGMVAPREISDADVVEYLLISMFARGSDRLRPYLGRLRKELVAKAR